MLTPDREVMVNFKTHAIFLSLHGLVLTLFTAFSPQSLVADVKTKARKPRRFQLELTYPAGESPKVFDDGWVFGARCIVNAGTSKEKDVTRKVRWSGTARFRPKRGAESRPKFRKKSGMNKIRLRVKYKGRVRTKIFKVETVHAAPRYARVGSTAFNPRDAHGCPSEPHAVSGPIINGSTLVTVEGLPAARKGDNGVHAACCGPNTFIVAEGDPEVLIEGKPAARIGDKTDHCGGSGEIISVETLPTPTPLPNEEFGVFGVTAGSSEFLIVDTEDDVMIRKPCSFDGGGLDCTSNVEYVLLAGPFSSEAVAGQALCDGISDGQYWALTKCKRRYEYNGKWYWGCEPSVSEALNNFCAEKKVETP